MIRSILVVCVGNICRSPLGARLLQQGLEVIGSNIEVSSAGLAARIGEGIDELTATAAHAHGVDLADHAARQFSRNLGNDVDLILVMEPGHQREIMSRFPDLSGKTMLFDHWRGGTGIRDPYRQPLEVHRVIANEIAETAAHWVVALGKKRQRRLG